MAKKKKVDYEAELIREYDHWEYLRDFGGSDPFYDDATNMNLVRNHIRNTGTLLYDEECDFAECVFHWQEEKFTLAQIEAQKCVVEGIEVRKHENTMQTARGRGNH